MLNKENDNGVSGSKINDKIANLSNNTKKMNFGIAFFIFKVRLAFTQLRKVFSFDSIPF